MRKVINFKIYDTENAVVILRWPKREKLTWMWVFHRINQTLSELFITGTLPRGTLYRTHKGNYFLLVFNRIQPLTIDEAKNWSLRRMSIMEFEATFGRMEEA